MPLPLGEAGFLSEFILRSTSVEEGRHLENRVRVSRLGELSRDTNQEIP